MKALVIGGTGPTGPAVVEGLLKRGYEVTIFHRGTHETDDLPKDVEHIHGDAFFAESLEAGLGHRRFDLVASMYGRLRLIAEVMKARAPRIIGITSVGAYKDFMSKQLPLPTSEDTPKETEDVDKRSEKHMIYLIGHSEDVVMGFHREGCFNATIFRYPQLYGSRSPTPLEWSIVRRILDGRKRLILPAEGFTVQDRLYCDNAAHGVLLAVDKPEESAGQIYNLSDEKSFSFRQWVELISQIMGHKWDELVAMPYSLAGPAQRFIRGSVFQVVMDRSKVRTELGYRDVVPSEEGLRRTVGWLLEHRPEPGGEEETRIPDYFEYEAEDQIIEAYKELSKKALAVPYKQVGFSHTYPHPKKPGEKRDHMGR